jgi:hypothetical protein
MQWVSPRGSRSDSTVARRHIKGQQPPSLSDTGVISALPSLAQCRAVYSLPARRLDAGLYEKMVGAEGLGHASAEADRHEEGQGGRRTQDRRAAPLHLG